MQSLLTCAAQPGLLLVFGLQNRGEIHSLRSMSYDSKWLVAFTVNIIQNPILSSMLNKTFTNDLMPYLTSIYNLFLIFWIIQLITYSSY